MRYLVSLWMLSHSGMSLVEQYEEELCIIDTITRKHWWEHICLNTAYEKVLICTWLYSMPLYSDYWMIMFISETLLCADHEAKRKPLQGAIQS